ncbi:Glu-tRNA(Gln) amidotransferase GatDE subunit E [candidate division KSB1 bacterium]|nr:MAG: Glu-tRNA(Gln) amidotransferase GatDE subunit E [candidate division KSB1 bacterium]
MPVFDGSSNYQKTKKNIGYIPRNEADLNLYKKLGFKCGLEIHQQLATKKKLFCRCPAGLYHKGDDYDAELVRHMRPTLSELGEYDGTALMEFKTRKNIIYRIKYESACTYDVDDTPPFPMNRDALDIAMEIALLLKSNIVGELHITRKQYLDGSIPTGFQRTGIVGIEGEIPISNKTVRIIQISIEEDACREVSDVGHMRVYTTDRLGTPLIEMVTYPDMLTPDEAKEAGQYLRFLSRSTGKVNTGIGAARQDVNVSITGGTRIEIKGVQSIAAIPELTHNEAFRQKALLEIKRILNKRIPNQNNWNINFKTLTEKFTTPLLSRAQAKGFVLTGVNLPAFEGVLSFFTQPGFCFANEISDRLKVVACLERPNMITSESPEGSINDKDLEMIQKILSAKKEDAQLVFWGPEEDVKTALETIEERCRMAFDGVPSETRKSLPGGVTIFERVLPGPDRMYPDTDSAPIPIHDSMIEKIRMDLPDSVDSRIKKMVDWSIPEDTFMYILRRNLFPLLEWMISEKSLKPPLAGRICGQVLRYTERKNGPVNQAQKERVKQAVEYVLSKKIRSNILPDFVKLSLKYQPMEFDDVLKETGYYPVSKKEIIEKVPEIVDDFRKSKRTKRQGAEIDWIMGELRRAALGNVDMSELRRAVEGGSV